MFIADQHSDWETVQDRQLIPKSQTLLSGKLGFHQTSNWFIHCFGEFLRIFKNTVFGGDRFVCNSLTAVRLIKTHSISVVKPLWIAINEMLRKRSFSASRRRPEGAPTASEQNGQKGLVTKCQHIRETDRKSKIALGSSNCPEGGLLLLLEPVKWNTAHRGTQWITPKQWSQINWI